MNRRSFLTALPGMAVLPKMLGAGKPHYGRVDVTRFQVLRRDVRGIRCWLNGEDVTNRCFEADDVEGWARMYLHGPNGKVYLKPRSSDLATETVYGKVSFEVSR